MTFWFKRSFDLYAGWCRFYRSFLHCQLYPPSQVLDIPFRASTALSSGSVNLDPLGAGGRP